MTPVLCCDHLVALQAVKHAVDDQVERPNAYGRKVRLDGLFAWTDDADGPLKSCGDAQAGTASVSPYEIVSRAE